MFKTLRGRVIASYFIVVIISLLLASLFFLFFLSRYIRDRDSKELLREVTAIARDVEKLGASQATQSTPTTPTTPGQPNAGNRVGVLPLLNAQAQALQVKFLLAGPGGRVLAESSNEPVLGDRTVQLPARVLSESGPRISERYFPRLRQDYLFATAPAKVQGKRVFLIALKTVENVRSVALSLIGYVSLAGGIALALSMLLALYFSGALSKPIREVTAAARRMADGDYSAEVPVRGSDETAELARDFNWMAERVRTAYELQKNFVGDVSHELRTPLTSIEGFSQALLDGVTTSPEEQRRSLEIINQESKRLVRVLRDLLLLSQIDAGEIRPDMRQADLVDTMRKLESIYSGRAEEAGTVLRVEPPARALTLYTDPDRLERVLTNLLDNAFKYAAAPGGKVVLSAAVQASSVEISVSDNGPGIPPEVLPHIFDRFYRVEKSRAQKHGGSGLGLSICKELVWTLGGSIKVNSQPGRGTTFTLTIPIT
jgi:signal transduction histidine kinase